MRVYQALDRYYGMRRSARYVNLCRSLEAAQMMRERAETKRGAPTAAAPLPRPAETRPAAFPLEGLSDLGGEYGYGRSWKEIAVDIGVDRRRPEGSRAQDLPVVQKLNPPSDGTLRPTIWETTDRLCRAEKKQDAVDAVLEYAAVRMARAIFLGVNDDVASVWDTRGADSDRRRKNTATFAVGEERLFQLLLGDDFYRGPRPAGVSFIEFYGALGMETPKEILLIPIYFDDHLVAFFYGDGGRHGSVTGETEEYVRLFRMFPLAVNQVVIKDSMRAIGYFFEEDPTKSQKSSSPETMAGTS